MPLTSRKDDFADGYSFDYTFTADATYTDLTYVYADGAGIVSSVTGNGTKTCQLTFKQPEVIDNATGKDRNEALKVTLYAMFKVDGKPYKESLEIRIQDCVCSCPAKISSTQWLHFQCNNLGGEDIYPGMTIERKHHGDWYRFGASTASMKNTEANDSNTTWDNAYVQPSDDWSSNPCDLGFRLPTHTEWVAVIKKSNNSQAAVGSFTSSLYCTTCFDAGEKFGDYLILPATGYRHYDTGTLLGLGNAGYNWSGSTSTSNSNYGQYVIAAKNYNVTEQSFRGFGFSVRCVVSE
jgi:uncharacterized protein (TIGR02145 family)